MAHFCSLQLLQAQPGAMTALRSPNSLLRHHTRLPCGKRGGSSQTLGFQVHAHLHPALGLITPISQISALITLWNFTPGRRAPELSIKNTSSSLICKLFFFFKKKKSFKCSFSGWSRAPPNQSASLPTMCEYWTLTNVQKGKTHKWSCSLCLQGC